MNSEEVLLTVPAHITVKYDNNDYSRDELSQAVSYWKHVISTLHAHKIIGVGIADLSFSNLAFMLALIDSGRDYEKIGRYEGINERVENYSALFITGDIIQSREILQYVPFPRSSVVVTDSYTHARNIMHWPDRHPLTICFRSNQRVIEYTSGSTGVPKKTEVSSYIQARSIETAIATYFDPNDYCVFLHNMAHTGVHTTAIFPGVFCASVLSLATSKTWNAEILKATHIQYFTTMRNHFSLPKKVRVLVFGGDMLKPLMTKHILDNCDVENFYDVYGLTECLPPLAIRKITCEDDLFLPFKWVNHYHQPNILNGGLFVKRCDGVTIGTGDSATLTESGELFLNGRFTYTVRLNGTLHSSHELKLHLEKHTDITSHVLAFENGSPVLIVLEKDQSQIEQYAQEYQLEADLRFQTDLNTNGGIKHIK